MDRKRLGKSNLQVSSLCFGSLTLSPLQRDLPVEEGAELLLYAFGKGMNIIDTAELYDNYPAIALALRQWQGEDILISTKSYAYDKTTAENSLEKARKALDRDVIDIFMLHEQESEHTLRGHAEALEYFDTQKKKGVIRALGISSHYVAGIRAAATHPLLDVVHPIYNQPGLGIVDGTRSDMEEAIQLCRSHDQGILGMKPLGGGHLISQREEALRFALDSPLLDCVAIGMQSQAEIDFNVAVAQWEDPAPFSEGTKVRKRQLWIHDWCIGCGKCVGRCQQGALCLEDGKAVVEQEKCILCGYCGSVCPEFCIKVL